MDMEILDSSRREGSDVDGITGGVPSVVGGAEGATSCIGYVEGTAGAGISTGCGFSRCFGCGISGCSGPTGAPSSALYAIILVHLSRMNISRQMRLHSS